jgi:hypothetical protein
MCWPLAWAPQRNRPIGCDHGREASVINFAVAMRWTVSNGQYWQNKDMALSQGVLALWLLFFIGRPG